MPPVQSAGSSAIVGAESDPLQIVLPPRVMEVRLPFAIGQRRVKEFRVNVEPVALLNLHDTVLPLHIKVFNVPPGQKTIGVLVGKGVLVFVAVGVFVEVGVNVEVGVAVGVFVLVGVFVGVAVEATQGPTAHSTAASNKVQPLVLKTSATVSNIKNPTLLPGAVKLTIDAPVSYPKIVYLLPSPARVPTLAALAFGTPQVISLGEDTIVTVPNKPPANG